jgi:hypothetical protein
MLRLKYLKIQRNMKPQLGGMWRFTEKRKMSIDWKRSILACEKVF